MRTRPTVAGAPTDVEEAGGLRNRSESEPIEVIFRKIAQREQSVPRSVEAGVSYQGVHAPAAARVQAREAAVVLNVTTEPATRVEVATVEAAGVPGRSKWPAILTLAVIAAVLLAGVAVLVPRT